MSSAPQANELADRLDRVLPPGGHTAPDYAAGDDPLVEIARRLARGPHPVLDDVTRARIQAQVLSHAAYLPQATHHARRSIGLVLRWVAAACLILVLLAVGTAGVSANSLPGDALYPVKRLVEQGRLALATDSGEVSLRLQFADRRLDEFEELLADNRIETDTLDDALDEMTSTLALVEDGAGTRDTALDRLADLNHRQIELAAAAIRQAEDHDDRAAIARLDTLVQKARRFGETLPVPAEEADPPPSAFVAPRAPKDRPSVPVPPAESAPPALPFSAHTIGAHRLDAPVRPVDDTPAADAAPDRPEPADAELAEPDERVVQPVDPGQPAAPAENPTVRPPASDPGNVPGIPGRPPVAPPGFEPPPQDVQDSGPADETYMPE